MLRPREIIMYRIPVPLSMIYVGLWFNEDSDLWMLPCMNSNLISSPSESGISTVHNYCICLKTIMQTVAGNSLLQDCIR
ncbi:hypothetical protein L6164_011438 [Bauhinia variegata]|uniref:Uncharacterized protein n=1 Tax=Bauhinia variegata TaxID=167791 RepID=A0ACB9P694_BAUVA|nr:hypothetical protein L6164_011438 [Bauhinia variegata]